MATTSYLLGYAQRSLAGSGDPPRPPLRTTSEGDPSTRKGKNRRHPHESRKRPFLFVRFTVPRGTRMTSGLIGRAMCRAYERSGFPKQWTGTHLLRHTAATRMYLGGATLKEVADVLGHASIDTTMIYTKVDLRSLLTVALPWPEA